MKIVQIYLSLGANLGNRSENIDKAIELLNQYIDIQYVALSDTIKTAPWGNTDGGEFLNAAIRYDIPDAGQNPCLYCTWLLAVCKEIERSLGRDSIPEYDEDGNRIYRARTIDIDILYYGDAKISTPLLTVPHPLIEQRDFVKIPLSQIRLQP